MSRRTPIDQLGATIQKVLDEYKTNLSENVQDAVKTVTKAGVKAVRGNAKGSFGGTGKYASGWTSKMETGRTSTQGFIYNGTVPGLPHLLEKDHALRNGGRYAGVPHIAPVEQEIIENFEKAVKQAIDSAGN